MSGLKAKMPACLCVTTRKDGVICTNDSWMGLKMTLMGQLGRGRRAAIHADNRGQTKNCGARGIKDHCRSPYEK